MSLGSDAALTQRQAEYAKEQREEAAKSLSYSRAAVEVSATSPLTFWKVAFAVFVGNLMFAVVAGIVYAVMHS
jgi:hypothetical protein